MRPLRETLPLVAALFVLALAALAAAEPRPWKAPDAPGKVTLSLSRWLDMQEALRREEQPAREGPVLWIGRRIEGRFHKGLWSGRLTARFEVTSEAPTRVPLLDARAIAGAAKLDGEHVSLLVDSDTHSVLVDRPGRHEITVDFHWGRETQRFTRSLRIQLPEGGPIALEARIAERGIEASLAGGALTDATEEGGDTVIGGHLDGTAALDLSWKRRETGEARGEAELRCTEHTLFKVSEALVTGHSALAVAVVEGETDTVTLDLPRGVEVLGVEGDAVLQWRTALAADESGKLVVLLRHLVSDATAFRIEFQLPSDPGAPIALAMPMPNAPTKGSIGVLGPPGLSVEAKTAEDAESIAPRDLPSELLALTESPVLFGFRFERPPRIVLAVTRLAELSLATTLVDELQASTVLLEDGTERTKLKLRIRNDSRQYVEMRLPGGAKLTNAFIDGRKVRPASREGALLLPLRQSERLAEDKERIHVVRPGETLSDVANLYYSDPSGWLRILNKNRDVVGQSGALTRGVRLRIPPATEAADTQAFFVIEVAYELRGTALGAFGGSTLRLPGLDVDTMKAVWHVYFPSSHEPLSFRGNLTQTSSIKYDPFRRIEWYLQSALEARRAWAGDGAYENILAKRRAIYNDEAKAQGDHGAALTEFPLVGDRYRFRRILLGREAPELRVSFASRSVLGPARHVALLTALLVTLWTLLRNRRFRWLALGASLAVLLFVAHYVPGVHRRILWGLDLALAFALLHAHGPKLLRMARIFLRAPWRAARALTPRRLIAAAGFAWLVGLSASYPLLLSLVALAGMSIAWWRTTLVTTYPKVRHAR
jgi:hypothetical protein